ncbi:arginine deiminase family protein [Bacteroidota bacterium]
MKFNVTSEIGELQSVILHKPGPEIERMTPENIERSLYSDILNMSIASVEYAEFSGILEKVSKVYYITDLFEEVINNKLFKNELLNNIQTKYQNKEISNILDQLSDKQLIKQLIEGIPQQKDTYTKFLSPERYELSPLHNFFFTRDIAVTMNNNVIIGKMANSIRERETFIIKSIIKYHPEFEANIIDLGNSEMSNLTIEGGDIFVLSKDVLLIGNSVRTNSKSIDLLIEYLKINCKEPKYIIIQQLPHSPESLIHLDMAFSVIDYDLCIIYEPFLSRPSKYQTYMVKIENGKVKINEEINILKALKKVGFDYKPIFCGGNNDEWIQEREQWHSGANFLTIAPGKVIGYKRNSYTVEELSKHGFRIIPANELIKGKNDFIKSERVAITLSGSELARGGGGARCMSLPIKRREI